MAGCEDARKGCHHAVIVALAFLSMLRAHTKGNGRFAAPAIPGHKQTQRMPLLVVDKIAQSMADIVHRDIGDREGEAPLRIGDRSIHVFWHFHRRRSRGYSGQKAVAGDDPRAFG